MTRPARAFTELGAKPRPWWGLWAVGVRFVVTSLTTILALLLLGRSPFTAPYVTFLAPGEYYLAEVFFLPVFGVATWLFMVGVAHLAVRAGGRRCDFDRVLNVVGFGMLVPMAVLWPADWVMIATDTFRLPWTAVTHASVELWEALLFAVGFGKALRLRPLAAVLLGVGLGGVYVAMAVIFVR